MRKFLKTCLIIGVVCIVAGVAASGAGIFNGGLTDLKEEVMNGEWNLGNEVEPFFELKEQDYFNEDEIINVGMDNTRSSFPADEIYELTVKSAGVTVKFTEYDGEEIVAEADKIYQYQAYLEEGELFIIARGKSSSNLGEGVVNVAVPKEMFDAGDMDIIVKSAASAVEFDRLAGADIELQVSAGTVLWNDLTARELGVEMSAGTVTGKNVTVSGESEIKVSAGTLNLSGTLGTETDIEMTAGMVNLELADAYTDYNYDVSCAGGSVTVGEQVSEGIAKSQQINNNALKNIDIDCSMGAVNINFIN